jgi:hypothetical protein
MMALQGIDFHRFVDTELASKGFCVRRVSQEYMERRLDDMVRFVNAVREEYSAKYGWGPETREYFLNGLNRKWDFSFCVEELDSEKIALVSFTSVYGDMLHAHFAYAGKAYRSLDCQAGLDAGFSKIEGYWPKNNNGSLIFALRMGWHIEDLRKGGTQLLLVGDLAYTRDQAYRQILTEKGSEPPAAKPRSPSD